MTKDDIINMARKATGESAWDGGIEWTWDELERFAELVEEATREHSAKMLSEEGWLMAATLVQVKK